MTGKLEIAHLRLLQSIVSEGSLTAAARQLHLSQPAASRRLEQMEQSLGVNLFTRAGRRLVLTAAGRRLLACGRQLLPQLDAAERSLAGWGAGAAGELRITTECYTAYHWLPAVVCAFQQHYPDIHLDIDIDATARPRRALLAGQVDLVLGNRRGTEPTLRHERLFADEVVAVVAADHPLAAHDFLQPADFADQHLITYAADRSDVIQDFLRPAGVSPRRLSSLQVTDGILQLVLAGLGITTLARWAIPDVAVYRCLRRIPLGHSGMQREWNAITLRSDQNPLLAPFIQSLKTHWHGKSPNP